MEPNTSYCRPDSSNRSSYLLLCCSCNLLTSLNLTNEGQQHCSNGLPIRLSSLQRGSEDRRSHHTPEADIELSLPEPIAAGCAGQEQRSGKSVLPVSSSTRWEQRAALLGCTSGSGYCFPLRICLSERPNWQRGFLTPAMLKFIYHADFS